MKNKYKGDKAVENRVMVKLLLFILLEIKVLRKWLRKHKETERRLNNDLI